MKVCFSLGTVYTIGPVNVCLFGGNTTATGLTVCGPVCGSGESCESIFYQKESICVPVTITPYATPGTATATYVREQPVAESRHLARLRSLRICVSRSQSLLGLPLRQEQLPYSVETFRKNHVIVRKHPRRLRRKYGIDASFFGKYKAR